MTPYPILRRLASPPLFAALGLLLALTACRSSAPSGGGADTPPAPEATYRAAIEDARTAKRSEVVDTLVAIRPSTPALRWQGTGDTARVLVATWALPSELAGAAAGDTLTTSIDVWVTVAPQVQQRCQRFGARADRSTGALDLRLHQLLGLPPGSGHTRFVEIWVHPSDLFRPCPDPEIGDTVCERSLPVSASPQHRAWYEATRNASYGPDGYPWTRLGYTYDWNPDTDEVGLSEFVIRQGARIIVRDVVPTAAYCAPDA